MRKRKQYYISQFDFKKVSEKDGLLYFTEDDRVEYPNSENLLFDLIYRLVDRKYDNMIIDKDGEKVKNTIPEMFVLKSKGINEEDEKEVARYEKATKEGVYVNGIKYAYSQKSASMIRTQKTVYVQENLKDTLEEYITLGVMPTKTVMAKWLSNKGLVMSTAHLMPDIPNIVVIPDYEKIIIKDVKMALEYEITEQDKIHNKELIEDEKEERLKYREYIEKREEVKELFTQEYLKKNFAVVRGGNYKTAYNWTTENRRVRAEELINPIFLRKNNQGKVFANYSIGQTEEIKEFPVTKELLGYETKIIKNNENLINCFDGMGLVSIDYMKKVEKFLGIKNTNAIQGRLPYIKGLFIKFDFKEYIKKELNTYEIVDLWGDIHKVDDIDILVTESSLKAKIELDDDGKSHWLFRNMKDYYNRLNKYEYKHFGISNFANDKLNKYAPTTYQLINALDLDYADLGGLARPEVKLIRDVIAKGDTASVKLFLDMISSEDADTENEDMKTKLDYIKDAIELNERMVFDKEIQKTIFDLAESSMYEIMRGRIRIPGRYQYITGDIFGFCEWAVYRKPEKVKGFLKADEFYCKGMENKEYIFARYPLTHYSEVKIAPFIENNNKYIEHLHNIIQLNMYDLTMPQLAGCDLDGDTVNVIMPDTATSKGKTIIDAVIEDYVIVNPADGAMAKEDKINIDTIWDFEKANLHNLTGAVTNINTTVCDKAVVRGSLTDSDLSISVLKHKQGEIIDSAKTGQVVSIPELLVNNNPKLPYFFKYIYGGDDYKYLSPNSPLSKITSSLENWIHNNKIFLHKDTIGSAIEDKSYLDIVKIHNLMIDDEKFDNDTYFALHEELTPIHNDLSTRRGEIYQLSKDIDKFSRNEDTKEQRKIISSMYAELYEETKTRAEIACTEVLGEYNQSILASVATRIAYEDSKTGANGISRNKNYLFGWIVAPEGIIENLKRNEDTNKTKLFKISDPLPFNSGILEVINNLGKMKGVEFPISLKDGKYATLHREGEYFAVSNIEKESNIETTNSYAINNKKLKELENYPATVAYLQKEKEELEHIFENHKVKIGMEKGEYLSLFFKNEFLCSFTRGCIINKNHKVNLNKYIGQDVKVKVKNLNKKSMDVTLKLVG